MPPNRYGSGSMLAITALILLPVGTGYAWAQEPGTFWLMIDVETYDEGQPITLHGNVGITRLGYSVTIHVINENNSVEHLGQVTVDPTGNFEDRITKNLEKGWYTASATYEPVGTVWTAFAVGQVSLPDEGLVESDGSVEAVDGDGLPNKAGSREDDAVDVYGNEGSGIAPPPVNVSDVPQWNPLYGITYNVLSMALSYPLHTTGDSTYDQATANTAAALYFGSSFAAIAGVLVLLIPLTISS